MRAAGATTSPGSRAALASLCETYWPPVHAFVRRSGRSADEASDLTQAFFARVIEKGDFGNAEGHTRTVPDLSADRRPPFPRQPGRLRSRREARRRPGARADRTGSTDDDSRRIPEPASDETPESIFEQRWALTVLEAAMERLKRHSEEAGDGALFETLRPFLTETRRLLRRRGTVCSRRPRALFAWPFIACGGGSGGACARRSPTPSMTRPMSMRSWRT